MLSLLSSSPLLFILLLLSVVISITIHEAAHAFAADYFGDPTAKLENRTNLNPKNHIDPLGLLFIIISGFGWGKPTPVTPYNLKSPRQDLAIISLAGPGSNLLLALALSLITRFVDMPSLHIFFLMLITLNVNLAIFNLLPISPLDGFKIVSGLLPENYVEQWESLRSYGLFILLFLFIAAPNLLSTILNPFINFFLNLFLP